MRLRNALNENTGHNVKDHKQMYQRRNHPVLQLSSLPPSVSAGVTGTALCLLFPSNQSFFCSCHLMNQAPGVCRVMKQVFQQALFSKQERKCHQCSQGGSNLLKLKQTEPIWKQKGTFTWTSITATFLPKVLWSFSHKVQYFQFFLRNASKKHRY